MTFFKRFIIKLSFLLFLLLSLVILDFFNVIDYNNITKKLSNQINILKIYEYVSPSSEKHEEVTGSLIVNYTKLDDGYKFEEKDVKNIKEGIVISIKDNEIVVKTIDDYNYVYKGIDKANVFIYKIVKPNEIIATSGEGYILEVYHNNEIVDVFE